MAETATLQGKVSLDTAQWYRGLRNIRQSLAGVGSAMGAAFKKVAIGATAIAAAAAGGLALAARASQQYGDEIAKASTATGIATDELSGLRYAASQSGLAWNDLQNALGKAMKMRPGVAFADLADELKGIEDPVERANAAMKIFGDDLARKVLPMMMQGGNGIRDLQARAERLGLIVSPEQGKAAERFGDAMADLRHSVFGLARAFLDLAPAAALTERLTEAVIQFRQSATFAAIRDRFFQMVNGMLDGGQRIIETWKALDANTKAAVFEIGQAAIALGALWYAGLVKPVITGIAKMALATSAGLKTMVASVVAFGAFLLGYQLGTALEKSFNFSGILLKMKAAYETMVLLTMDMAMGMGRIIRAVSDQIFAARRGKGFDIEPIKTAMREMLEEMRITAEGGQKAFDDIDLAADPKTNLGKAFSDAFSLEGLMAQLREDFGGLADLLPVAAIDDIVAKWKEMAGVRFGAGLPGMVQGAKEAADDAERERDARRDMRAAEAPFRGFTRVLGKIPGMETGGVKMGVFRPQPPRPMNADNPRLIALAEKQLAAERAAAEWLAAMNSRNATITSWQ